MTTDLNGAAEPGLETHTEALAHELSDSFRTANEVLQNARGALWSLIRLVRQLERHARDLEAAASQEMHFVRVRTLPPLGPDGKPIRRGRGRPKGVRNGAGTGLMLYATAAQVAALRASLQRQ